jgi:hypothetical protein
LALFHYFCHPDSAHLFGRSFSWAFYSLDIENMKRLNLLWLFVAALFVFTSCKKDDPEPTPTDLIAVKWKITNADVKLIVAGFDLSDEFFGENGTPVGDSESVIEFKKDGTFVVINGDGTAQTGEWEFLENETKIRFSGLFDAGDGDIAEILSPTDLETLQTYDVVVLDNTTLQIRNEVRIPIPAEFSPLPIPIEAQITQDITFAKQN